jgi:hypothetical protein
MDVFNNKPIASISSNIFNGLECSALISKVMYLCPSLNERSIKDMYYHIFVSVVDRERYKACLTVIEDVLQHGWIIHPWRCGNSSDGLKKSVRTGLMGSIVEIDSEKYLLALLSIKKSRNRIYPYSFSLYSETQLNALISTPVENLTYGSIAYYVRYYALQCSEDT